MDSYLTKKNILSVALATIISMILNGGIKILNVSLSPTETVITTAFYLILAVQIIVLVILIMLFVAQLSSQKVTQKNYTIAGISAIYVIVGLLSSLVANEVADRIQLQGYQAFLMENQFIINAIEDYQDDFGDLPETLDDLYSSYLAPPKAILVENELELNIPYQSIDPESARRVSYNYRVPDKLSYEITVSIYLGNYEFVQFIYNPEKDYTDEYKAILNWGYKESID